jgi:hypothetical protein
MKENPPRAQRHRNLRSYTKCNIGRNRPKDDIFQQDSPVTAYGVHPEANLVDRLLPGEIWRYQKSIH